MFLAEHPKTLFVGQAVKYLGTAVTHQLININDDKKLEFPVAEDFQAGFCLGLALENYIPVCIYPRFNFLLLAANQVINHVDKWVSMTKSASCPKIIFKVVIGSDQPLDPGHQHKANYTEPFKQMCDFIDVIEISNTEDVFPSYKKALEREDNRSTILIEHGYKYNNGLLLEE